MYLYIDGIEYNLDYYKEGDDINDEWFVEYKDSEEILITKYVLINGNEYSNCVRMLIK